MNRQQTTSYPTDATAQFLRQMIAQQQQQQNQQAQIQLQQQQNQASFGMTPQQFQIQQQQQQQLSSQQNQIMNSPSPNMGTMTPGSNGGGGINMLQQVRSGNASLQSSVLGNGSGNNSNEAYLAQQQQQMQQQLLRNQQQQQQQNSLLHQNAQQQQQFQLQKGMNGINIQQNNNTAYHQMLQQTPQQNSNNQYYADQSERQTPHGSFLSPMHQQTPGGSNSMQQNSISLTQSSLQQSSNPNANQNFRVVIRVRPPLQREMNDNLEFMPITQISPDSKSVTIQEYLGAEVTEYGRQRDIRENPHITTTHQFSFDQVYGPESTQSHVYESTARPAVLSVLEGYNATILAYGQTGTGKTYTMEGFKYHQNDPQRGIIPRAMEEIFRYIQNGANMHSTFMVRASYLQIYNENISDLLKTERSNLQIREDKKRGVFVEGLSEWAVRTPHEIYSLMQRGAMVRATAATKMNDVSSRSHAVFIMIVEQMNMAQDGGDMHKQIKVGKLNLVDLAGSERVRVTGATGKRLEECKKINQSLSALGNVIAALTDMKARNHIPYRDSKLTRLLEDSLGGNCKTTMMAMVSPAFDSFNESLSTLKFATRAKKIKNEARINEDVDQRTLLRKYENELKKLREELELRSQNVVDKESVLRLEQQKRRAEEDKQAAIIALETRSREFMLEKEEKKKLEEKIKMLNSQLLIGGKKIEDTPQFKTALEEKQRIIRQEYEGKLSELERERQQIEEDKAQVDRYKQLLLKQRDIMIALTARLNERDETIIQLQEELDAYERIHRDTEIAVDKKQERIMQLEQIMQQRGVEIPFDEEGADRPMHHHNIHDQQINPSEQQARKYLPYEQYHLDKDHNNDNDNQDDDAVPLQLMTADEKVDELQSVLDHKDTELEDLRIQLHQSIKPDQLKERVEQIVQKEVEERVRSISQAMQVQMQQQIAAANHGSGGAAGGDSGSSANNASGGISGQQQAQQLQYMEKKLKISEEKNDALKNLLTSKDDEIERVLNQKVALTNLFENDLLQMTDKLIGNVRQVRSQDDISQLSNDMSNLQKLISVSFQALKGSMMTKAAQQQQQQNNSNMPLQRPQTNTSQSSLQSSQKKLEKENNQSSQQQQQQQQQSHTQSLRSSSGLGHSNNNDGKIPQAIDQMLHQRYLMQQMQQQQQQRYQ